MASAEDYANWIVSNPDKKGTPEFNAVAEAYQEAKAIPVVDEWADYDVTQDMSGVDKFLSGAGKGMTDVARGVGQLTGLVSDEEIAESRARDKNLMDTGAGVAGLSLIHI